LLTPDFVKLSHNGASDAQASVYLWVHYDWKSVTEVQALCDRLDFMHVYAQRS